MSSRHQSRWCRPQSVNYTRVVSGFSVVHRVETGFAELQSHSGIPVFTTVFLLPHDARVNGLGDKK